MKRITKEDREIIAKVCPKFSRICQCYVNNPEYGVTLSLKAKRALNKAKNEQKRSAKSRVVSVRLGVDEVEMLQSLGIQISDLIKESVKETIDVHKRPPMSERLSREVSDMSSEVRKAESLQTETGREAERKG